MPGDAAPRTGPLITYLVKKSGLKFTGFAATVAAVNSCLLRCCVPSDLVVLLRETRA